MIDFKNDFPRIGEQDTNPDFRTLFPWGCDQLKEQFQFTQGYYLVIKLQSNYRFYLAVKYGVWSFPETFYKACYSAFHCIKKPLFFVFLCDQYYNGIARVTDFEPEQSFKYFNAEGFTSLMGTIKIKFVKIGKVNQTRDVKTFLPFDDVRMVGKSLHTKQVSLFSFRQNDRREQEFRNYYKITQNLVAFEEKHNKFSKAFGEFQERLDNLIKKNQKIGYIMQFRDIVLTMRDIRYSGETEDSLCQK